MGNYALVEIRIFELLVGSGYVLFIVHQFYISRT